ncbi:MAG: hypothetical protein JJT78_13540 [Leptospira sp.]|nr:hypothetical protein [Leptospira sp.]
MEQRMEQRSELNPELFEMVKSGKLSSNKILGLISLKNLVDNYATKPFIENAKLEEMKEKFGVYPDILTWGDFFQTEIASKFFDLKDDKFQNIIDTIRFDLVSAYLIFSGKPDTFKDQIRTEALISKSIDSYLWSFDNEENVHLEILLDYFENLGLGKKPLPLSEKIWYESFDLNTEVRSAV